MSRWPHNKPHLALVADLEGGELYKYQDTWITKWKVPDDPLTGYSVIVPVGYCTNFASIPRPARWLVSKDERDIKYAACVHDYLVGEFNPKGFLRVSSEVDKLGKTRSQISWYHAAEILGQLMKLSGAPWWKRSLVTLCVKAYGLVR